MENNLPFGLLLFLAAFLVRYAWIRGTHRRKAKNARYRYYTRFGDRYPELEPTRNKDGEDVIVLPDHVFVVDTENPGLEGELIDLKTEADALIERLGRFVKRPALKELSAKLDLKFHASLEFKDAQPLVDLVNDLEGQLQQFAAFRRPVARRAVKPGADVTHVRRNKGNEGERREKKDRPQVQPDAQDSRGPSAAARPESSDRPARPERPAPARREPSERPARPERPAPSVAAERPAAQARPVAVEREVIDAEPTFEEPPMDLVDLGFAEVFEGASALADEVQAVAPARPRTFPSRPAFNSKR